jgi:antitoxin component YwqK of YwqJK toxin-antitoxin module
MEMDFMALLAQFHSKFLMLLVIFFWGCKEKITFQKFNSKNTLIVQRNDTVFLHNKPFTGILYTLYDDKKHDTMLITQYWEGKPHGFWKSFYEKSYENLKNQKIKEIRQFDKGKKVGKLESYWENGQKKLTYFFENDEYQGTCKTWSKSGILISEMNYQKGHEEGSQKTWYDNGKIRANYIIKKGRRFGLLGTKNCKNVSDKLSKK